MSLSNIDFSTLESIKQFKAFFDLVQNPKQFADIVKEAEKVSAEARKVVEAHTTVELANEYLAKAKAFASEKTSEIEAKAQAAQEASNKRQAQVENARLEAEKLLAQANKASAEAQEKASKLFLIETAQAITEKNLEARANELYQKEVQLQGKEKELNQKAAKLKELLG